LLRYLFSILLLVSAFASAEGEKYITKNHFELMINSKLYHKKNVRIYGYLVRYTAWHYWLYPYKEDHYIGDVSRVIEIDGSGFDLDACESNYVIVAGVFNQNKARDRFVVTSLDYVRGRDPDNKMDGYVGCSIKR
jgi:hypothetical protein